MLSIIYKNTDGFRIDKDNLVLPEDVAYKSRLSLLYDESFLKFVVPLQGMLSEQYRRSHARLRWSVFPLAMLGGAVARQGFQLAANELMNPASQTGLTYFGVYTLGYVGSGTLAYFLTGANRLRKRAGRTHDAMKTIHSYICSEAEGPVPNDVRAAIVSLRATMDTMPHT